MADTKTAGYDASTGEFTPPDGYTLSTTGTWKGNVYLRYASTTAGSDDLVYTLPGMVGKTFNINGAKTVVLDHEQDNTVAYAAGTKFYGSLAHADTVTIADSGTYNLWDTSKFSYIDTLDASSASGSVAMAGGYGDKTLIGSSYADKLAGTSYNTTIDGGAGNDTIWCKSGKETILFGTGSGRDVVYDFDGSKDEVRTKSGSLAAVGTWGGNVCLRYTSDDVLNIVGAVGKSITVDKSKIVALDQSKDNTVAYAAGTKFYGSLAHADTVTIADSGTYHLWDTSKFSFIDTLDASSATGSVKLAGGYGDKTLIGSSYADVFAGTSYHTTIRGGAGDDIIYCKSGRETIEFGTGDGSDTVYDADVNDQISFYDATSLSDLSFTKDGNNLVISLSNSKSDKITLTDWVTSTSKLAAITLKDGTAYTITSDYKVLDASGKDQGITFSGLDSQKIYSVSSRDGDETLSSYQSGKDVIQLTDGTYSGDYKVSGSDVILTVGSQKITITGGVGKILSIWNQDGTRASYYYDADGFATGSDYTYSTDKTYYELTTEFGAGTESLYTPKNVYISDNEAHTLTVNASGAASDTVLQIMTGESSSAVTNIIGGAGTTFMKGAANVWPPANGGTINYYGGSGTDVFRLYATSEGTQYTIWNYTAGKDIIVQDSNGNSTEHAFNSYQVDGTDIVLYTSDGSSVRVKNITDINDLIIYGPHTQYDEYKGSGKATFLPTNQRNYVGTKAPDDMTLSENNTVATLSSSYSGDFYFDDYYNSKYPITTVDARKTKQGLVMTGTERDETFYASTGNSIINGNGGTDTVYFNSGYDTLEWAMGADSALGEPLGNAIVYNYDANKDELDFERFDKHITGYTVSGSDIVVHADNGHTLTIKNFSEKAFKGKFTSTSKLTTTTSSMVSSSEDKSSLSYLTQVQAVSSTSASVLPAETSGTTISASSVTLAASK
jgi:hypothetical protein